MPRLPTVLVLLAAATAAADDEPAADALQGHWKVVSVTRDGKPLDTSRFGGDGLVVSGHTFTITRADGRDDVSVLTVDTRARPAAIDLRAEKKNLLQRGIWKVEKDTLTVAFTQDPERPKEFAAPAGSTTTVAVFERVKKK